MSLLDDLDGEIHKEQQLSVRKDPYVNELYFATEELIRINVLKRKIWRLDGNLPVHVANRPERIDSLYSHDGVLYDAGSYGVSDILHDPDGNNPLAIRPSYLDIARRRSLCSVDGKLYDGRGGMIFETLVDKEGRDPILSAHKYINDSFNNKKEILLCNHNDKLYCVVPSTNHSFILDVFSDEVIATRFCRSTDLCSNAGKLYDASYSGLIFDSFNDSFGENPVAKRDNSNNSILNSYNGILYDANGKGIFNTFFDKEGENPIVSCGTVGFFFDDDGRLFHYSKRNKGGLGMYIDGLKVNIPYFKGKIFFEITAMCLHKRRLES